MKRTHTTANNDSFRALILIEQELARAEEQVETLTRQRDAHPAHIATVFALKQARLRSQLTPWLYAKFVTNAPVGTRLMKFKHFYEEGADHIKDGLYADTWNLKLVFENGKSETFDERIHDGSPSLNYLRIPSCCRDLRFDTEEVMWDFFNSRRQYGKHSEARTLAAIALAAWMSVDDPRDNDSTIPTVCETVWGVDVNDESSSESDAISPS